MKSILLAICCLFSLLFFVSCATDNSDKSLSDLAMHMAKHVGGSVSALMRPEPVWAMEGIAMKFEGREVAFYKYDLNLMKQRRKVNRIKETGVLYISGIKFEAEVNGSFVMIDHATNVKKKELIKTFQSF